MPSPSHSSELLPGTKVGDYEVIGVLGQGGMGTVYRGVQPQIGKQVAIKVLSLHTESAEAGARFLREAQVVNRIGHAGLVDIFSFGQLPNGRHYLIMELLTGESLAVRLGRAFTFPEMLDIFGQILLALQAAHDHGVVHRDLKPDNIYLTGGSGMKVKILDFGLAKDLDSGNGMTHTGIALGTPRYMAPEQSRGGKYVDHRADLYAVGLILYEAITGRFPFEAPTPILMLSKHLTEAPEPPSRFARLPAALEAVVLRALAKDPAARYQSGTEMAAALREISADPAAVTMQRQATVIPEFEGEETRLSPPQEPARHEVAAGAVAPRRSRYLIPGILAAVVGCGLLGLTLYAAGRKDRAPEETGAAARRTPPMSASPSEPSKELIADPPIGPDKVDAVQPGATPAAAAERPRRERPKIVKRPAKPTRDMPVPF